MYSYVIDGMTWSYSRIRCFYDCPYQFFLKYIYGLEEEPRFFSSYGSFIHSLLAKVYSGDLSAREAYTHYICSFKDHVVGKAPSPDVRLHYFEAGAQMFERIPSVSKVIGVEKKFRFKVKQWPFIAFVDLIVEREDGCIEIWDHKSHTLRPRSRKSRTTKTDAELDEYLRQLYLYAVPVSKFAHREPDGLVFHCYRSGLIVKEPFRADRYRAAKDWAVESIREIRGCEKFSPRPEYFKCKYLCGVSEQCEYCSSSF